MDRRDQPATPERQPAFAELERRFGPFGGRELRQFPLKIEEVRDSNAGDGQFTVRGHAAVFNQWSLDLGGFREKVDPAFFDKALARNPDVFALWDHDTRYVLGRTASKTLDLRVDPIGLHYWTRVAPTSYAADLRVLMERGDINQSSFAFTVEKDEWLITEENGVEIVERTLLVCAELYDVTVTAMGAYPQTDSQVARSFALDYAVSHGRLPSPEGTTPDESTAPDDPAGVEPSRQLAGGEGRERALEALRARSRSRLKRIKHEL